MKTRSYVSDANLALYLVVFAITILGTFVAIAAIWDGH
jgi:hypothetical protein